MADVRKMETGVYATMDGRVAGVVKVGGCIYWFLLKFQPCILPHVLYTAVCYPPCENGGTCIIPGTCICPVDWQGHRCEM